MPQRNVILIAILNVVFHDKSILDLGDLLLAFVLAAFSQNRGIFSSIYNKNAVLIPRYCQKSRILIIIESAYAG